MRVQQLLSRAGAPAASVLASLQAIEPDLVLVFGSVAALTEPGFAEALRTVFPKAGLAGCTTAGEITADGVLDGSCVVTAIAFGDTAVRVAEAELTGLAGSQAAGDELGAALAGPGLAGVLLFGRGTDINGSALIDGVVGRVGPGIPVSGGLAGDDGAFVRTFVLSPSGVSDTRVVAVGLYGKRLRFGHGSFGGWEPFGPARKVTRCDGNILYELDGEPALNVYKRYLGDYAKDLPASGLLFPFELLNENHSAVGLIRTILGIDEAAGSLTLAGTVADGFYLRLMHASTDALIDGAESAARSSTRDLIPTGQSLGLLVSCVGRKLVMGDQVDEEVQAVADHLGGDCTLAGFYSYGEISPIQGLGDCKLHNQTMTVAVLSES